MAPIVPRMRAAQSLMQAAEMKPPARSTVALGGCVQHQQGLMGLLAVQWTMGSGQYSLSPRAYIY